MRLYVLIKGVDRIEAYICEEGIARFCTVSLFSSLILSLPVTEQLQEARWDEHAEPIYALDELQPQQAV